MTIDDDITKKAIQHKILILYPISLFCWHDVISNKGSTRQSGRAATLHSSF